MGKGAKPSRKTQVQPEETASATHSRLWYLFVAVTGENSVLTTETDVNLLACFRTEKIKLGVNVPLSSVDSLD